MDLLLTGGIFYTMEPSRPTAEAVLIRDGRFQAVGSLGEVQPLASPDAEKMDLGGAAAYPGMTDSHLHILNLAVTSRQLELNGIRSREGALNAVKERASRLPAGAQLDGRGFNEDLWDDRRLLTRRELDEAAPNHPVRLTRVCGHMVIVNSMAMELAGITPDTPIPDGGYADCEKGVFAENAIGLVFPNSGDAGVEACKELLLDGMSMAADAGLTSLYTDDFGAGGFSMHTVVAAYRELEKEGRMPVRVVQQCALPDDEQWNAFREAGYAYGQGSDFYRIGPRKLYADGSLGARTALLSVPYADQPKTQGVPIYSQQELNRLAEQTHRAGMPFLVHAIGDLAAERVVNAIVHARNAVPGTDALRDGIVHCQITTPELLSRIAEERVDVYAQPVFVEYDLHICRDRVGEELEKSSYAWKTLISSGVCVSSGSDCPVEPLDPAKNIYCAVTRKDFDGFPEGGWLPEQRLSVEEAVRCHTLEAARAAGFEEERGRIAPGCLADLTVFPADLSAVSPEEILGMKPVMTVVGGRVRNCR